jgi:hypothetical protein
MLRRLRELLARLSSSRGRLAILVLAGGLLLAALPLMRKVPHDREVHLELDGRVGEVELTWFADEEAIRQTTLSFTESASPHRVTARLSVPDGRYRLELCVDRGEPQVRHVDFTEGVDSVTIPVR